MKKQMKKISFAATAVLFSAVTSCKKEECHDCHYDFNEAKIELGERCGDALETLEADGYPLDGEVHEVHCHED